MKDAKATRWNSSHPPDTGVLAMPVAQRGRARPVTMSNARAPTVARAIRGYCLAHPANAVHTDAVRARGAVSKLTVRKRSSPSSKATSAYRIQAGAAVAAGIDRTDAAVGSESDIAVDASYILEIDEGGP